MVKFLYLGTTILALVFSLTNCGQADQNTEENLRKDSLETVKNVSADAHFELFATGDESDPWTIVYAVVNGNKTQIAKIPGYASSYEKANYSTYEIPENAIDACGGWWAGGGDYFYMIAGTDGIDVFVGWQDEGQEDEGYHWEKRLTL
jgi:hypothetical protein